MLYETHEAIHSVAGGTMLGVKLVSNCLIASIRLHPIAGIAATLTISSVFISLLQSWSWIAIAESVSMTSLAIGVLSLFFWFPLMLRMERSAKRRRQGKCVVCGYDLRATPERCPECGAVPTGKSKGTS